MGIYIQAILLPQGQNWRVDHLKIGPSSARKLPAAEVTTREFVFSVRFTDNTGYRQHSRAVAVGRNKDRDKPKCRSLCLGGVGSEAETPSKDGREIRIQD